MKKIVKKGIGALCCVAALGAFAFSAPQALAAEEETWAIYWYVCGSDLESDQGDATDDMKEMLTVTLPENVTVVVETGGAESWTNGVVDPDYLERYVYKGNKLDCVWQAESASMGDPNTLADFLDFCTTRYPADHTAVIFWNHGGGSLNGALFDDLYDRDSLSLMEFHEGFEQVCDLSAENPPFDFVGFDCCLMGTFDTAWTFHDIAQYLVASEEVVPGYGWDYSKWLGALAENPNMSAEEIGTVICDSFLETNKELECSEESTLSLIKLSEMAPLLDALNEVGNEALEQAAKDTSFVAKFFQAGEQAEDYGGNTDSSGYFNLVDMKDLMEKCAAILPKTSGKLINAVENCVVHKVNGEYKQNSFGLSCYFSINKDPDEVQQYCDMCASESISHFYQYSMEGIVTEEMHDYFSASNLDFDTLEELPDMDYTDMPPLPVTINDEGTALISVDEAMLDTLVNAYSRTGFRDENGNYFWLGYDNNMLMDWENGVFGDDFRDQWGTLDGHLCYMELSYQCEDYNRYLVPILLNGEKYQLHLVYDYKTLEYSIVGASKGISENGAADKNLVQLKPGDEITTILYLAYGDIDAETEEYEFEKFEVSEETSFYDALLGDGEYVTTLILTDIRGNQISSEPIIFYVEDGKIRTGLFQEAE